MATVTANTPTQCATCGRDFLPRWNHGHWQRYCSLLCANRAQAWAKIEQVKAQYGLADDGALRQWLVDQLNRRTVTAVAALCGVNKQALYQWMQRLGIRKTLRYE